jgi:hypothetical protein
MNALPFTFLQDQTENAFQKIGERRQPPHCAKAQKIDALAQALFGNFRHARLIDNHQISVPVLT